MAQQHTTRHRTSPPVETSVQLMFAFRDNRRNRRLGEANGYPVGSRTIPQHAILAIKTHTEERMPGLYLGECCTQRLFFKLT